MSKKKLAKSAGAVVVATAIAVGATFAWQGSTQRARNEVTATSNPGGRLHDDFYAPNVLADGAVKQVYVENFADQDLFVRIRLREYMELGESAGTDTDNDTRPGTVRVLTASDAADPHITTPEGDDTGAHSWHVYTLTDASEFRTYWSLTPGGAAVNYMPTFNRNKDSLVPDLNGSNRGDFDDYHAWTDAETKSTYEVYDADDDKTDEPGADYVPGISSADLDQYVYGSTFLDGGKVDFTQFEQAMAAYNGDPTKTTEKAAYEAFFDPDTADGDAADIKFSTNKDTGLAEKVEHTVKQSQATTRVMPMAEWIVEGYPVGSFWVYDTDGWAYWAAPLAPADATGCLISGFECEKNPNDSWYYAIDVDMECATIEDWGSAADSTGFYTAGITDEAVDLLNIVAGVMDPITGGRIVRTLSEDVCVVQLGSFYRTAGEDGEGYVPRATKPWSSGYGEHPSWCHYAAICTAADKVGSGNLETVQAAADGSTPAYEFRDTPADSANAIQWVKIRDTEKGKYMYISDRSLLAGMSYAVLSGKAADDSGNPLPTPLGTDSFLTGVETTIDGKTYTLRLLTGGLSKDYPSNGTKWVADGPCLDDPADPTSYSEWDRYVGGYGAAGQTDNTYSTPYVGTINGLSVPSATDIDGVGQTIDFKSAHAQLWGWAATETMCQTITIPGEATEEGTPVEDTTLGIRRSSVSPRGWLQTTVTSGVGYHATCFRPCFEIPID